MLSNPESYNSTNLVAKDEMVFVLQACSSLDIPISVLGKNENDLKRITVQFGGIEFLSFDNFCKDYPFYNGQDHIYHFPEVLASLENMDMHFEELPDGFLQFYFFGVHCQKTKRSIHNFLENRKFSTWDFQTEAHLYMFHSAMKMLKIAAIISDLSMEIQKDLWSKGHTFTEASAFRYPSIIAFAYCLLLYTSVEKHDLRIVEGSRSYAKAKTSTEGIKLNIGFVEYLSNVSCACIFTEFILSRWYAYLNPNDKLWGTYLSESKTFLQYIADIYNQTKGILIGKLFH